MTALDAVARLRCRVVSLPLGAGPPPSLVVRAAAGADGLVALIGSWADGDAVLTSDPVLVLNATEDPIAALDVLPVVEGANPAVVGGGWFGALAYDGPSRLAFHDHLLRHRDGSWFFEALWSDERDALLQARRDEAEVLLAGAASARWRVGRFGGADRSTHLSAVERAVELIRAGEIYQVNVCARLDASFSGSGAGLFADAVDSLHPVYGAFVGGGERALASFSPELFLRRRGRDVRTSPIKGTAPRVDGNGGADALRRSAKDAAENVMIVDLMRNDLGRVCEVGSVRASSLLDIEAHPGVWHLVSTVTGRLREDVGDAELLRASFPPGSVSGAPKSRAVTAIGELEERPRGAYTGAIGFVSPSWGAELSVTIRTFELAGERIELGVGGGVTADSVPMLEWRECLHKAAPLLGALGSSVSDAIVTPEVRPTPGQLAGGVLETVLAVDGVLLRGADHLARLDCSVRELYGVALPARTAARMRAAAHGTSGRVALRVVFAAGSVTVSAAPARPRPGPSAVRSVASRTGLWRHKWAERGYLTAQEDGGAPLFVAADGAVLETSRGNVFLLAEDGTLVTPPLRDDLLPGVTRRAVLDLARDEGRPSELRPFDLSDLRNCAAFWTSSLSLVVPIASVDGVPLPRRDAEVRSLAARLESIGASTVR
ncbi:MAG: aminodeoxychorismate synthase component I [Jatrophihabitantaceae bacterium]